MKFALLPASHRSLPIFYGRPWGKHGIQNAIYHPALAHLHHAIRNLETLYPNPETAVLRESRSFVMSMDLYGSEYDRSKAIFIEFPFDEGGEWTRTAKPTRVSAIWRAGGEPGIPYMLMQFKNEVGIGGDPVLQSLVTYLKEIGTQTVCALSYETYYVLISPSPQYSNQPTFRRS